MRSYIFIAVTSVMINIIIGTTFIFTTNAIYTVSKKYFFFFERVLSTLVGSVFSCRHIASYYLSCII